MGATRLRCCCCRCNQSSAPPPPLLLHQVGGWTVRYERLTFASVRGAGHMVPYTQPARAFHLFDRWVNEEPL